MKIKHFIIYISILLVVGIFAYQSRLAKHTPKDSQRVEGASLHSSSSKKEPEALSEEKLIALASDEIKKYIKIPEEIKAVVEHKGEVATVSWLYDTSKRISDPEPHPTKPGVYVVKKTYGPTYYGQITINRFRTC